MILLYYTTKSPWETINKLPNKKPALFNGTGLRLIKTEY